MGYPHSLPLHPLLLSPLSLFLPSRIILSLHPLLLSPLSLFLPPRITPLLLPPMYIYYRYHSCLCVHHPMSMDDPPSCLRISHPMSERYPSTHLQIFQILKMSGDRTLNRNTAHSSLINTILIYVISLNTIST